VRAGERNRAICTGLPEEARRKVIAPIKLQAMERSPIAATGVVTQGLGIGIAYNFRRLLESSLAVIPPDS